MIYYRKEANMKVRYYVIADESDIYDEDDDLEEEELLDIAWEWAMANADVGFEIIEENN